jgi:antitoxin FitA
VSVNLSIKGVPESVAERLRQRAERNHRSLQGELMAIIEQAAQTQAPAPAARTVRQGWKTVEDLVAERLARPFVATPGLPLAVDIIRADRDSR